LGESFGWKKNHLKKDLLLQTGDKVFGAENWKNLVEKKF
jgi:hypothetical protein